MPIDTSMYGSLGQGSPMQSLNSMVTAANGVANLQSQKNANVMSGLDAQEMQALQPVLKNTAAYTDERGNVDFNKFVPMVMQSAPKNGAAIVSHMATAQQQKAQAQNAISTQSVQGRQAAAQAIYSIDPKTATPDSIMQTGQAIASNFNDPNAQQATLKTFQNIAQNFAGTKPDDPLRATQIKHVAMMFQPIQDQQTINTPNGHMVDNYQQSALINQKEIQGGIPVGGVVPGTMVQKQLPPNTRVMNGDTPSYLGPQPVQPTGPIAAELPVGAGEGIGGAYGRMAKTTENLNAIAATYQNAKSTGDNIENLMRSADTGTGAKQKGIASAVSSLLGIPEGMQAKDANDLLYKNIATLNTLVPGSTDAAQALLNATQPNSTMNSKAQIEAKNQFVSRISAATATRDYLNQFLKANGGHGDATGHQDALIEAQKVNDPKIWQYKDLKTKEQRLEFVNSMSTHDREALLLKMKKAEEMGLLK